MRTLNKDNLFSWFKLSFNIKNMAVNIKTFECIKTTIVI